MKPLQLSLLIGSIAGAGSYISGPLGQFSETGNFSVALAGTFLFSDSSASYCAFDDLDCQVDINFGASAAGVFGFVFIETDLSLISFGFNGFYFVGAPYSSDGTLLGCGSFANCQISGVLVSPVPEPSTAPILLAGLAMFGWMSRKRNSQWTSRAGQGIGG